MQAGAIDFLTKPLSRADLLGAIARAEDLDSKVRQNNAELASIRAKIATLTPREREVLTHVVAGKLNKQIAYDLGTVEKTIKVHRADDGKAGAAPSRELRMAEKAGIIALPRSRSNGQLFDAALGRGKNPPMGDASA